MKTSQYWKKDPISNIIVNSLSNLPTPKSISFMWNIGFILGIIISLQLITGLVLSINYIASRDIAFNSVIHIIRDLDSGWIIRYTHINGASLFFILLYTHIGRGLYFNAFITTPIVWCSGVVIFLTSMATAFIGYVLPWGQISFWGATVITRIISAIPYVGLTVTQWLWGNFSVSQPTLNRFFSLHFIIPIFIIVLIIIHLMILHKSGSSTPTITNPNLDKIKFYPFFLIKDINPLIIRVIIITTLVSINPNLLGDVENFNEASPLNTPTHIQPEWYFLYAYAILRAVPSKLGGVILIILSIICLIPLIFKSRKNTPFINKKFSPLKKIIFWNLARVWIVLTWIGMKPVEEPFTLIGKVFSFLYFLLIGLI